MIKVLVPGFLTSVQDLGRIGFANIGIPISGVMDQYSSKLANAILDNKATDAVIEITFGNCKIAFDEETFICVSGADFSSKINNKHITLNIPIKINSGDILSFEKKQYGSRTYLAVIGGFKTEKVLNSRSFYNGVTSQVVLKRGDCLLFNNLKKQIKTTFSSVKFNNAHFDSKNILCFRGPEYELLSKHQKEQIEQTLFTISNDNNRMGYQLNEKISNTLKSMLTSAVLPGTVQLTPSGKLIVLMRDCQVTGGYPRILVLTKDAINKLSQKTTNDSFCFEIVDFI